MNSLYSFQFPAAPDSLLGGLVAADTIQDHWLQTGVQLQRDWLDNTRGLFNYYQTLAKDSQEIQNVFFSQYMDWIKSWSGVPASSVDTPPRRVAPISPKAALQYVEEKAVESEMPLLLGWVVDDLTRIQGVGKVLQQRLYEEGIVSYLQIASWDKDEIARIEDEVLGSRFAGRVSRDQWQVQAKELMNG